MKHRRIVIVLMILILAFFLRTFRLDALPGEMWGDVIENYRLAEFVLEGGWYTDYRFLGDGPLFSYIAAFVAWFVGLSFYSLKLTTVLIGTAFVAALYYHARAFSKNDMIAYLAGFLGAVGFWGITFSRQAKPYILVPLFVSLIMYFILTKRQKLAGIFVGLGMYAQAAFWGSFLFIVFGWQIAAVALLVTIPFFGHIVRNPEMLFSQSSYIGEKLNILNENSLTDYPRIVITNLWQNLQSFHIRGDNQYQHNVPGLPHVDQVTGIFLLIGFAYILYLFLRKKQMKFLHYLIIPFLIAQSSSVLDVNNPAAMPNMGRMIGALPFVCIVAAYGIYFFYKQIKNIWSRRVYLVIIFVSCLALNFNAYFVLYPAGLPNENIPLDRIVATYIDNLPSDRIVVAECCFAKEGRPQQEAIRLRMQKPREITFIERHVWMQYSCHEIVAKNMVLILDPRAREEAWGEECPELVRQTLYRTPGEPPAFHIIKRSY